MMEQSSIKFVAGAFALLLLVPLVTGTGIQRADAAAAAGIMVPLYTYPGSTWNTVIETKNDYPDVPIVAIVNPASGPGGSKDSNYDSGIDNLKSAGVIVLGYVSTAYTGRSLDAVRGDIDRWASWYNVDGIFFDEQTNWAGGEWYYTQAGDYAESKGLDFTVGNPGANSLPSYLATVDVVLIYESPGLPNLNNYGSWGSSDNAQLGMIPFSVSSLPTSWVEDATEMVSWIYVTNDSLPNPWDSLPGYFDDLAELLNNGPSSSPEEPEYRLTVRSVDQAGDMINGMWMEVKENGATVRTGFTPLALTLEEATYTVSAGNYRQIIFDHWSGGSESSTMSVNLRGDSEITAHYTSGAVAPVTPLSVVLSADNATVAAGASITFGASVQGGAPPYTWSVNFGDGTSSPHTSDSTITKTYSAAGTYSAVATARDSAGKAVTSNPVEVAVTQGTDTLTVETVDADGDAINGYYTTLWQDGVMIESAFSPASFTLNSGQTYSVQVADYGDYVFDHWSGGSTNRDMAVTGGQAATLTAFYKTAAPEEVTLTVRSIDFDGKAADGLWTVVKEDGATVKTGYTPLEYTALAGSTYEVSVANYQNYIFDHWDSGSKSSTRQVTVNDDTTVTAHYGTGSKEATLTVRSAGLDGSPITGLWTVVSGSGATTGFTPLSYAATAGSQYTVTMGEYRNYVFDHWDNGSTSKSRAITPSGDTVLTAYYRQ